MTDLPPGSDGTSDPGTPDPGHDAGAGSPPPGGSGPDASTPPPAGPPTGPPPGPPTEAGPGGTPPPPPSSPGALDLVFGSLSRGWNRMVEILFRGPYANLRGWFAWGLLIVLAGVFGSGGFFGENVHSKGPSNLRQLFHGHDVPWSFDPAVLRDAFSSIEPWEVALLALGILLLIVLGLFVLWLTSVFRYVFLEDVIAGRPAIREPFARAVGRSQGYFAFRLVIALVMLVFVGMFLLLFGSSLLALATDDAADAALFFPMVLFGLLVMAPVFLVLAILRWFVHDLVLPVHVLRGGTFGEALREGFALAGRHFLAVLLYAVSRFLAAIVAMVAMMFLFCITCCLWLPPFVVVAVVLLLPTMAFWPLAIVTVPLFLAAAFLLRWVLATMIAPWPVFVCAWSVSFVQGLLGEGGESDAAGTI